MASDFFSTLTEFYRGNDEHFNKFKSSVHALLLLKLRDSWPSERMAPHRDVCLQKCSESRKILASAFPKNEAEVIAEIRKNVISAFPETKIGDIAKFPNLKLQAKDSVDIWALGDISALVDVGNQFADQRGFDLLLIPLFMHVYAYYTIEKNPKSEPLEDICKRFGERHFWRERPQTVESCEQSLEALVLRSMGAQPQERKILYRRLHESSSLMHKLVSGGFSIGASIWSQLANDSRNRSAVTLSSALYMELEREYSDYQALSDLPAAIHDTVKAVANSSTPSEMVMLSVIGMKKDPKPFMTEFSTRWPKKGVRNEDVKKSDR